MKQTVENLFLSIFIRKGCLDMDIHTCKHTLCVSNWISLMWRYTIYILYTIYLSLQYTNSWSEPFWGTYWCLQQWFINQHTWSTDSLNTRLTKNKDRLMVNSINYNTSLKLTEDTKVKWTYLYCKIWCCWSSCNTTASSDQIQSLYSQGKRTILFTW